MTEEKGTTTDEVELRVRSENYKLGNRRRIALKGREHPILRKSSHRPAPSSAIPYLSSNNPSISMLNLSFDLPHVQTKRNRLPLLRFIRCVKFPVIHYPLHRPTLPSIGYPVPSRRQRTDDPSQLKLDRSNPGTWMNRTFITQGHIDFERPTCILVYVDIRNPVTSTKHTLRYLDINKPLRECLPAGVLTRIITSATSSAPRCERTHERYGYILKDPPMRYRELASEDDELVEEEQMEENI
ncbi:hypothetical protein EVAR_47981_1 [Eumeta japonica]|uniref:Uncharacterized protein n=1 Tax=Eumeta variegata TaxID=151549 RepID=A0A4C1XKF8_EUMVA|nr:hypothetical protein EVAR_47981_1 [Eumeta japonica]